MSELPLWLVEQKASFTTSAVSPYPHGGHYKQRSLVRLVVSCQHLFILCSLNGLRDWMPRLLKLHPVETRLPLQPSTSTT